MLLKRNLLVAGLTVLLTVTGQSFAVAGGNHGGSKGGGSGGGQFNGSQFSNNAKFTPRPNFSVQTPVHKSVGNFKATPQQHFKMQAPVNKSIGKAISQPTPTFKAQQFKTQHSNTLLQTGKLSKIPTTPKFQFPNNVKPGLNTGKLGIHTNGKLGSISNPVGTKIGKLPVLPTGKLPIGKLPNNGNLSNIVKKGGIGFPGSINVGKVNPIFHKPFVPTQKFCPPFGGVGKCGTGYGGCWGNGCGFGGGFGNWGCGNWGHGHWGCGNYGCGNYGCGNYQCGYWPGYFNGCSNYPVVQPYPLAVSTTYVSSAPVVEVVPVVSSIPLNDQAVPLPPAPTSMREIDLVIKEVQVVEAASADRGALYRVTIINMGTTNMDVPTRVAALAMKDNQPTEESPRVLETVKSLQAGETVSMELRMPVTANALPKLLVAVEIPENFKDTNEMNNVAAGEVAQLPQPTAMVK